MADELPIYGAYPSFAYGITASVGEFFALGAAGGSALHFSRALFLGSPGGGAARLAGAVSAVRRNAPRVAGTFAFYCAGFCAIESAVSLARGCKEEDFWSCLAASAATWGLHGMRRGGAPAAARGALLGAAGFAALMGVHHATMSWTSRQEPKTGRRQPLPVAIHASRTAQCI